MIARRMRMEAIEAEKRMREKRKYVV